MRLNEKVAIITGAGGGIGRASALLFAREGARVAAVDINQAAIEETARLVKAGGGQVQAIVADVSKSAETAEIVRQTLDAFGLIDVLFNNAATTSFGQVGETSDEELARVFAINLNSVVYLCRAVVPLMQKNGAGSIINTSSITGIVGAPGMAAYSASKGAIITLTRTLALEVAEHNIRVNCLCPASIETPMLQASFARAADPEQARRQNIKRHPLGRFGTPEDAAYFALFLASDESSWVTGGTHVIDGGAVIARRWQE